MFANSDRKIYTDSTCEVLERISFTFGDRPEISISFPDSTIEENDELFIVMDSDFKFADDHGNPITPMIHEKHAVTRSEEESQSVTLTVSTRKPRFLQVVNHRDYRANRNLCHFRICKLTDADEEGKPMTMTVLGMSDNAMAFGIPGDYDSNGLEYDTVTYMTRAEINAVKLAMDAELASAVDAKDLADESARHANAAKDEAIEARDEAVEAAKTIPVPTVQEAGKVLGVDASGEWEFKTGGGGGSAEWGGIGGDIDDQLDLKEKLDTQKTALETHTENTGIHVTSQEKTTWSNAATSVSAHTSDTAIHVSGTDRTAWNGKEDAQISVTSSTAASLACTAGGAYSWSPAGNGTISLTGTASGKLTWTAVTITPASGATITGSGVTLADSLTGGKTNRCGILYDGSTARLYVFEVEA